MASKYLSWQAIDQYIWSIKTYLIDHYGYDSRNESSPLSWYVGTGRASSEFLHSLLDTKVFKVARACHKGGTDQEVIERVKALLGYESTF